MFRHKKNVDQLSKKIMRHCSNGLTHIIILWIISKEKNPWLWDHEKVR